MFNMSQNSFSISNAMNQCVLEVHGNLSSMSAKTNIGNFMNHPIMEINKR